MKHSYSLSFLLISFFFAAGVGLAQSPYPMVKCGELLMTDYYEQNFPGYKEARRAAFEHIQRGKAKYATLRNSALRIPVVFHVIHHNNAQNLPDSLIHQQLDILNTAFRHSHADTGSIRTIFKPLAGDTEIEFYLAETDPEGNASSGITRTFTEIPYFGSAEMLLGDFKIEDIERIKYTDQGGFDGWPGDRYLNIWIADMGFEFLGLKVAAILGLATPPRYPTLPDNWPDGSVDGIKDGVMLQYQTISANNPYVGELFDLASAGRTAVHEVGHYFGLRHINGDDLDGECVSSDGIDDTPFMVFSDQSELCPDPERNSCGEADPNDLPDMWENYMDYSNDQCQGMFTIGQGEHMRAVILAQRDSLLSSKQPVATGIHSFKVYPNPAADFISFEIPVTSGQAVLTNAMGQVVARTKVSGTNSIETAHLISGLYQLSIYSEGRHFVSRFFIAH